MAFPLRGLTAADFVVTDKGVQQIVDSIVVDQLPLSVQLVLDTSGSVSGDRLHTPDCGRRWAGGGALARANGRAC